MKEGVSDLNLHKPPIVLRALERLKMADVAPWDICPKEKLEELKKRFPDLFGDRDSFEPFSASWRGNPDWWREWVVR